MNSIFNLYEVKFSSPANFPLINDISSVNDFLSIFVGDHYTITEACSLVKTINEFLINGTEDSIFLYTESLIAAVISKTDTNIYESMDDYLDDNTLSPTYSLPTADFLIIVTAWKDYISKSPNTKYI